MQRPITPTTQSTLPLPLKALTMAKVPQSAVTPALLRAIEQWCEVLPVEAIAEALHQVAATDDPVYEFRQVVLAVMRRNTGLSYNSPVDTPLTPLPPVNEPRHAISPAVRKAIAAQDRLESMSDADYQGELIRRLRDKVER